MSCSQILAKIDRQFISYMWQLYHNNKQKRVTWHTCLGFKTWPQRTLKNHTIHIASSTTATTCWLHTVKLSILKTTEMGIRPCTTVSGLLRISTLNLNFSTGSAVKHAFLCYWTDSYSHCYFIFNRQPSLFWNFRKTLTTPWTSKWLDGKVHNIFACFLKEKLNWCKLANSSVIELM